MSKKLILGTVQMGKDYGINNNTGKISISEIFKILDFSFKNGINIIDTAADYGDSEKIIGDYLLKNPNKYFLVNTKISSTGISFTDQLMNSINNLKINKIETIYFHSYDIYLSFKNEISKISKKYKHKYFNQLGVSLYTNEEIEDVINDEYIDRIQTPFNLLDNLNKRKTTYLKIKSSGKNIDVRSIFLQGLFFMDVNLIPDYLKPLKIHLALLKQLCHDHNIQINDLAIAYVKKQQYIDNLIIGVDNLENLKINYSSFQSSLSTKILNEINKININEDFLLNPSLWGKL